MRHHPLSRNRAAAPGRQDRAAPLHWSLLFGIVSLSCFVVLAVSGIILLFFYDPSTDMVRYGGSYPQLQGVAVSKAYDSTLHLSLDVPGGLLVRQVHHWAALVLPGSLLLQMLCTFFTGGFRRPRQWSWVLLVLTFLLALAGGWSGYALPDDLLAGTGLHIVEGILVGIPIIGTSATLLLFGGEYPGVVLERLYWLHVAVVPALLILVLALRLRLAVRRRPARFRSRGTSESEVVGFPLPTVAVRALGLFLVTSGVLFVLAGILAVNPVWTYGPSSTAYASAGSQPDWYTAFLDGALRLVPSSWDFHAFGGTLALAVLIPQAVVGLFLTLVLLWPFLEARATGDRGAHQLLDRPHERPTRTAFGVAGVVFFLTLWVAGATDLITTQFRLAFEHQVVALRVVLVLGPVVAFHLTRALCREFAARDRERALHGVETGRIIRGSDGDYSELRVPPNDDHALVATGDRADDGPGWAPWT